MTQPIPDGHHGPIPHLVCSPCDKAIEFYEKAFGAEKLHAMSGPGGKMMHAEMMLGGRPIMLADDFPEFCGGQTRKATKLPATPVTIHLYVEDTDATMKQAEAAGATITMPAMDMFWGDRYGKLTDPFGHDWSIATHQKDMTPEEMNEAGQKAMSEMGG